MTRRKTRNITHIKYVTLSEKFLKYYLAAKKVILNYNTSVMTLKYVSYFCVKLNLLSNILQPSSELLELLF